MIQEGPDLGGKQGVISCHCNELDWLFASSVVESGGDLRVSHEDKCLSTLLANEGDLVLKIYSYTIVVSDTNHIHCFYICLSARLSF